MQVVLKCIDFRNLHYQSFEVEVIPKYMFL